MNGSYLVVQTQHPLSGQGQSAGRMVGQCRLAHPSFECDQADDRHAESLRRLMSHTGYRPTYERFISRRTGRHESVHPGIYERLIPRGPSVLGRRSRRPLYDPLIAGERGRPRDPPRGGLCTAHNSGDDFPDPSIRWRTGLTAGRAGEALCGTTRATTPTDALDRLRCADCSAGPPCVG